MYPCCAKLFLLSPESVYPLSCTSFLEITVIDVYVERNYFSSIFFSILLTERTVMSEWFPSNTRASKHQYAEQYVLNEHGTLYFTLLIMIEGERVYKKSKWNI